MRERRTIKRWYARAPGMATANRYRVSQFQTAKSLK
jgi:hypothetical protein